MAKKSIDRKELPLEERMELMEERLKLAGVSFETKSRLSAYCTGPDELTELGENDPVPVGFKRCGCCGKVLKYYMFNKNSASPVKCSGSCYLCQKEKAAKSYKKTKKKRNYAKYYKQNREKKLEHAKKYYQEHKEDILAKQKAYGLTKKGKAVMKKAHTKRAEMLAMNKGIPYTRELVIERDKVGFDFPVCYLCGEQITDVSGNGLHLDHVVGVVNGGLDCFTNIACVHKSCNLMRPKDNSDITKEDIDAIAELSETFMDANPDLFDL